STALDTTNLPPVQLIKSRSTIPSSAIPSLVRGKRAAADRNALGQQATRQQLSIQSKLSHPNLSAILQITPKTAGSVSLLLFLTGSSYSKS
ncbi:MAG: hypothetical protein ABSG07_22615, partial [Terriglobales bacterium]